MNLRRSNRVKKPSLRVRDPDNAERQYIVQELEGWDVSPYAHYSGLGKRKPEPEPSQGRTTSSILHRVLDFDLKNQIESAFKRDGLVNDADW